MHTTSPTREVSLRAREPELSLAESYQFVRRMSAAICSPLTVEDHSLQPMPDASPAKWHLAHTTWFFETMILAEHLPGYRPFHPAYRNLFNSYYNTIGDRPLRALRHILSRPGLEEVHTYRAHVDEGMARLLTLDLAPAVLDLVVLGINHEQQHQELIVTDVKNGLWSNPLRPPYRDVSGPEAIVSDEARPLRWRAFDGGVCEVGFDGEGFAFDNEGPRHKVFLAPFRLASRLVTNAEYLDFMRDGGYNRAQLWLSDGWDVVRANRWSAPLYWEQRDAEWWNYTLEGMKPVDPNQPVCHISYYEADAFAHWAGARLATEFEWEVAAGDVAVRGNFLDSNALHPTLASASEPLTQMFGDVWEWTASAYTPYPGFTPAAGAVGEYNGKFMCNQMVLRGGSCATPQSHIRSTYRNFFPPHARWQFMGIRLANGN
jgi:ergothioneine biosynthesis protein EgtB